MPLRQRSPGARDPALPERRRAPSAAAGPGGPRRPAAGAGRGRQGLDRDPGGGARAPAGEPLLFSVGSAPAVRRTVAVAGLPHVSVTRTLDPRLLELNRGGAINGHVPVTAIVSCLAVIAALVHGAGRGGDGRRALGVGPQPGLGRRRGQPPVQQELGLRAALRRRGRRARRRRTSATSPCSGRGRSSPSPGASPPSPPTTAPSSAATAPSCSTATGAPPAGAVTAPSAGSWRWRWHPSSIGTGLSRSWGATCSATPPSCRASPPCSGWRPTSRWSAWARWRRRGWRCACSAPRRAGATPRW